VLIVTSCLPKYQSAGFDVKQKSPGKAFSEEIAYTGPILLQIRRSFMFYTDDGFDDVYGHPELLPHKLPGLREIRCGQCGHEMQILEQFEEPSVPCAQCGQAVVLHGFGLEIPEDNSELEAELPATVFRVEGRQQQRKASRLRDLRYWGLAMVMIVIYIAFEIAERMIRRL
jgi:hypothetical protein